MKHTLHRVATRGPGVHLGALNIVYAMDDEEVIVFRERTSREVLQRPSRPSPNILNSTPQGSCSHRAAHGKRIEHMARRAAAAIGRPMPSIFTTRPIRRLQL